MRLSMRRLRWIYLLLAIVVGFLGVYDFGSNNTGVKAQSVVFSSARDPAGNAIMANGAMSVPELQSKYGKDPSIAAAYSCFGISPAAIANMSTTAIAGQVTSQNTVLVNGTVVATNAVTMGRQFIPGSTSITCGSYTFYKRPPSVSFASSPLDAFIVENSAHQFLFAIIASCGNPVLATPVATPTATPTSTTTTTNTPNTPAQPTPSPAPSSSSSSSSSASSASSSSASASTGPVNVSVVTPSSNNSNQTPAKSSSSSTSSSAQPQQLVNTGPGSVAGLFASTTIGSGLLYSFVTKRFKQPVS